MYACMLYCVARSHFGPSHLIRAPATPALGTVTTQRRMSSAYRVTDPRDPQAVEPLVAPAAVTGAVEPRALRAGGSLPRAKAIAKGNGGKTAKGKGGKPGGKGNTDDETYSDEEETGSCGKAAKGKGGKAVGKGNTDDESYSDKEVTNSDEEDEHGFHGNFRLAMLPGELGWQRFVANQARLAIANNERARLAREFELELTAQREEKHRADALRRNGPWAFARRAWVRRDEALRRASPYFHFPEFDPDGPGPRRGPPDPQSHEDRAGLGPPQHGAPLGAPQYGAPPRFTLS
jgi:hypothetical protein